MNFHTSRSGRVHDRNCLSLTHDGACDCLLLLAHKKDVCANCRFPRIDHVHSRLRGYLCPGGRGHWQSEEVKKVLEERKARRANTNK